MLAGGSAQQHRNALLRGNEERRGRDGSSHRRMQIAFDGIAPRKKPEDFLFTRKNGEVVKGFRGAWEDLTETAGVPGLLERPQHDPPGVPQKTPRTVSGHKTDAVFSRSNIVSEDDIRDAARRIEEGAKAAVSGSIHSSFIVAPNQGNEGVALKDRKPS
jgi:hypothetical protein